MDDIVTCENCGEDYNLDAEDGICPGCGANYNNEEED